MDRRKKIINFCEAATHKILSPAAERNGAQVFSKPRIADVLEIDHSGLNDDLYSYALKAHFDFIVADDHYLPLFALEFDGPSHNGVRAKARDKKKKAICDSFEFPLARVRDEHIFRKARGIEYVGWLTELFFSFQALADAQKSGAIPLDEPLDPMLMFFSHPHIQGRFPLFISAEARTNLREFHQGKVLSVDTPFLLHGKERDGRGACLAVIRASSGRLLCTTASIYLEGFGILSSDAAEEIAVVNLALLANEYAQKRERGLSSEQLRDIVVRFLRAHDIGGFGGDGGDFGFSISYSCQHGQAQWRIGALGDASEVCFPER